MRFVGGGDVELQLDQLLNQGLDLFDNFRLPVELGIETEFNRVAYDWPSADAEGVLHSDGAGGLSWEASEATPLAHDIDSSVHTLASATAGHVLRATSATAFAIEELQFSDLGGSAADGQVPESAVTQHEAAFDIAASQVDAGTFGAGNYVFPGTLEVDNALTVTDAIHGLTIYDRGGAVINVKHSDYGVVGDDSDETSEIQSAYDAAADGDTVLFPSGTYRITSQIRVSGKDLVTDARNAKFTLVGDNAGFLFDGAITHGVWLGGRFTGDGVSRDADSSKAQIPITVGNSTGADVNHFYIYDLWAKDCNVGIKIAGGVSPATTTDFCTVVNPYMENMVGAVGGVGYGVQFSQANGSSLIGGNFAGCKRHSVYFAEGKDYRVVGADITAGGTSGNDRGCMSISRSADVQVTGCIFHDIPDDYALVIDVDTGGVSPNNVLKNVRVDSCNFYNVDHGAIRIGTSNPSSDGVPFNVSLSNITIKPGVASPDGATLRVDAVDGLYITNLTLDLEEVTLGSHRSIELAATDGAAFTDNVVIDGLYVNAPNSITAVIQLEAVLCTGSSRISINHVEVQGAETPIEYVDDNTNTNLSVGIAGITIDYIRHLFKGDFTSGGTSTVAALCEVSGQLTGAGGDTGWLAALTVDPTIVTQTATESIGAIATLRLREPQITDNLTGDITVAATLHIVNAPSEGEDNYALWVESGAVQFDDTLDVDGAVVVTDAIQGITLRADNIGTPTRGSLQLAHISTGSLSPQDGDIWTTTAGLFVRVNGSTVGPLS